MMDTVKRLQEKANNLHILLEKYAKTDDDVAMVLGFMAPLLKNIQDGKVTPPQEDKYRWYFFNTDSPLFLKYKDLSQAEGEYAEVLQGWDFPFP